MIGSVAGALLIVGSAGYVFAELHCAEKRQRQLWQEIAASWEAIAAAIRWKHQRLPEVFFEMQHYPLAGDYYKKIAEQLNGDISLQFIWDNAFTDVTPFCKVELSGDEEKLIGTLHYASQQLLRQVELARTGYAEKLRLRLACLFSMAAILVILLL